MNDLTAVRAAADQAARDLTDALAAGFLPAVLEGIEDEWDTAGLVAVRFDIDAREDGGAHLGALRADNGVVHEWDTDPSVATVRAVLAGWSDEDSAGFREWARRQQTVHGNANQQVWVELHRPTTDDAAADGDVLTEYLRFFEVANETVPASIIVHIDTSRVGGVVAHSARVVGVTDTAGTFHGEGVHETQVADQMRRDLDKYRDGEPTFVGWATATAKRLGTDRFEVTLAGGDARATLLGCEVFIDHRPSDYGVSEHGYVVGDDGGEFLDVLFADGQVVDIARRRVLDEGSEVSMTGFTAVVNDHHQRHPFVAADDTADENTAIGGPDRKRAAKALMVLGVAKKAAFNVVDGNQPLASAIADPAAREQAAEVLRCYRTGTATAWAVRVLLTAERVHSKVRVSLTGPDTVAIRLQRGDEAQTTEDDWSVTRVVDADGGRALGVPTGLPADHRDPLTIARALADVALAGRVLGQFADYERRQVAVAIRQGDLDDDAADITVSDLWHSWEQNPHQDEYVADVEAAGRLLSRLNDRLGSTLIDDLLM